MDGDVFYYVDGFHGGVDGHFPLGTMRDILAGMDAHPDWKVSLEIEPYSWAIVEKSDPGSIGRMRELLGDHSPAGRLELVSGAYAQSYMWNLMGESVIRHIRYGLEEIHAVFPEALVDTYAVQEPCWTSCLPQILRSFGYRRAALSNSTCWGGYHAGRINADLCNWTGPDGAAITTAPRYGCDGLLGPATEENAELPEGYLRKCHENRIAHPVGTILQDAGWPGRPWVPGHTLMRVTPRNPIQHVTWREYVDSIAEPATQEWKANQEDLRVGLAWGATIVQRIAQVVRAGENETTQAERLAAMASLRGGQPFPEELFRALWTDLLLSQHHDVWIVPYNRNNIGTWASECDARYAHGHKTCAAIVRDAMASLAKPSGGTSAPAARSTYASVFNSLGSARRDIAAVDIVATDGTSTFRVFDASGKELPSQIIPRRKFVDGSLDSATVLFTAQTPAMGWANYRIESVAGGKVKELLTTLPSFSQGAFADIQSDIARVETDQYRLTLDLKRGGTIRSLFDKQNNREVVDTSSGRRFNEYRGFFPDSDGNNGQWLSTADSPAEVDMIEAGPVRVTLRIKTHIGAYPVTTLLSVAQGQRRIDVTAAFDFPIDGLPFERTNRPQRVRIGEPWPISKDATRSDRRPIYDSSWKLQALFPAALGEKCVLHKNAAFDVCRSELADTRFDSWQTIKHNVIVNWVDLTAADELAGLAVMCDHTTAYHHGDRGEPLGLVLGYSGLGNWFDYAIGRAIKVSYAIVPHTGDWAAARLWRELAQWSQPLTSVITLSEPAGPWSLIDAGDTGLDLVSVERVGDQTVVRLFNAEGNDGPHAVAVADEVRRVEQVELDGRVEGEVPIQRESGVARVSIALPRFAVRTLRLS